MADTFVVAFLLTFFFVTIVRVASSEGNHNKRGKGRAKENERRGGENNAKNRTKRGREGGRGEETRVGRGWTRKIKGGKKKTKNGAKRRGRN